MKKIKSDLLDLGLSIGLCFIFFMAFCLLIKASMGFIQAAELMKEVTTYTVQLKSITYQNKMDGFFVLGTGKIAETDYYTCYEVLEDGGIQLINLEAKKTVIYSTLEDNEEAYAEMDIDGYGDTSQIRLYVPKNTIQSEYDFDLQ